MSGPCCLDQYDDVMRDRDVKEHVACVLQTERHLRSRATVIGQAWGVEIQSPRSGRNAEGGFQGIDLETLRSDIKQQLTGLRIIRKEHCIYVNGPFEISSQSNNSTKLVKLKRPIL